MRIHAYTALLPPNLQFSLAPEVGIPLRRSPLSEALPTSSLLLEYLQLGLAPSPVADTGAR